MTQQRGKFRFRLLANDGSYPPRPGSWQEVEVLPPPKLVDLEGHPSPQIELEVPAYTDLPSPERLAYLRYAFETGMSVREAQRLSAMDPWFLHQMKMIADELQKVEFAGFGGPVGFHFGFEEFEDFVAGGDFAFLPGGVEVGHDFLCGFDAEVGRDEALFEFVDEVLK